MTTLQHSDIRKPWLPILILILCEISRGFFIYGVLPNRHDQLSTAVISYAMAAHYTVDTLSKLWIGWLLDRLPRKTVVILSLALSFVALYELGYATTTPVSVICWCAAFGLGTSAIWMYVLYEATRLPMDVARSFMSSIFTSWFIAIGIGYAMGNASVLTNNPLLTNLLDVGWGIAFLLAFTFPGDRREQIHAKDIIGFQKESLRNAWFAIPGMFAQTFSASLLLPILQDYLQRQIGLSLISLAGICAGGGAALVAGLFVMGRLKSLSYRKTLSAGLVALGLAIFGIGQIRSFDSLLGLAVIIGGCYAVVLSSWNTFLLTIVPKSGTGLGWGVISIIEGAGIACGSSTNGIISQHHGISVSIAVSASILLALGIWYFPFRSVRVQKTNSPAAEHSVTARQLRQEHSDKGISS